MGRQTILDMEKIREMCRPVVDYLENNGTPYNEVHISVDAIKVTSVECCIPLEKGD